MAALTNIRKPPYRDNTKLSRGHLVRDFLSQQLTAPDFISSIEQRSTDYGLFNLLLMDNSGLWHYSNDSQETEKVAAGTHGLSNATLDTPWPKLTTAVGAFEKSLGKNKVDHLQLLSLMQSQIKPQDDELPNTGIELEFERFLSPIFIQGKDYGTRCTTLLTIDQATVKFLELSYAPNGKICGEVKQKINVG